MNVKRGLIFGFLFAFLVVGISTMQRSMPATKEKRIYDAIKVYIPYKLEKKVGGLAIIDTRTGDKEKPSAAETMLRFDELQATWGKKHLKVIDNDVHVIGENNQTIVKIFIETQKERDFLKSFFGI
ncbi:MAG: hypothetical protein U9Q62_12735 [Campylobacterota bacterium]|nr:hypothetical protein [Campylobacterota bacterium]